MKPTKPETNDKRCRCETAAHLESEHEKPKAPQKQGDKTLGIFCRNCQWSECNGVLLCVEHTRIVNAHEELLDALKLVHDAFSDLHLRGIPLNTSYLSANVASAIAKASGGDHE